MVNGYGFVKNVGTPVDVFVREDKMKTVMWVGVGDSGNFPYWPSLSSNKMDCKRKIYDWLYAPIDDKPDWSDWEFRQIEMSWVTHTGGMADPRVPSTTMR